VRRGAGKKNRRTPPVHLLNPRPTHPPVEFIFLRFCSVRFWTLLGKGSSKTPLKHFCKKCMSKTFFIKTISMSVFLDFFWVCLSDRSSETPRKTFYQKIVTKIFCKSSRLCFLALPNYTILKTQALTHKPPNLVGRAHAQGALQTADRTGTRESTGRGGLIFNRARGGGGGGARDHAPTSPPSHSARALQVRGAGGCQGTFRRISTLELGK
jgi:hypothetical protein